MLMVSICPDPDPWFKHSKGRWGRDYVIPLEGHRESKSWGQAAHTAAPSLSWAQLSSPEGLGCGEEMLLNDLWTWRSESQMPPSQCRGLWPQTLFCCYIRCHWTEAASESETIKEQSWTSQGLSAARWGWKNIQVIPLCQQHWKNMQFMVNPRGSSNRGQTTSSVPSWQHTDNRERLGELLKEWPGLHGQVSVPKSVLQRKLTSPPSQPEMGRTLGEHSPVVMNPKLRGSVRCILRYKNLWDVECYTLSFFLPCVLVIYFLHPPGSGPGGLLWASAPPWEGKSSSSHLPAPTLCFRPDHLGTRSTNKLC